MERAVVRQLARAGHICGADVGGLCCVREPGHPPERACSPSFRDFTATPVMRERVRRAKAVVRHEAAERHAAALAARVARLEERREWAEGYLGFRVEYRIRGALRRLRRVARRLNTAVTGEWT